MSQYGKITAGETYDLCKDVSTNIGSHSIRLTINNSRNLSETNFNNNLARLDYKNLADQIAPNFTLGGPYNWNEKGTCFLVISPSDNVTALPDLKFEQKVDGGDWGSITDAQYCFTGASGSSHTYSVHAIDARGNINLQTKTFNLF